MPDNARQPLRRVVIAGDGPVGLCAAIALRRALPRTAVVLVPAALDDAALADCAGTTLPSSAAFHHRHGIDEAGLVQRAGASHRLAVQFTGWCGPETDSLLAYGAATPDGLGSAAGPAVAGALALLGRFSHPADDQASPLSDLDYALRFSAAAYRRHLATLASHLGVNTCEAGLAAAVPGADGTIAHLKMADGDELTADLYVDCTGPRARLASALPGHRRESWAGQLPCDRLLIAAPPQSPRLTPLDRLAATPLGWRSAVHGRDGTAVSFACNAAIGSAEAIAAAAGFEPRTAIAINPGRLSRIWHGNVVSFGDAAAQFEPLQWTNLALAHAQILLFLELLPGRIINPLEQAEFNRRAGLMADRLRDFIALHYRAPHAATGPFWKSAARLNQSDELRLTVAEYTRRGRVPFIEEDPLPRDTWISALGAVGIEPGMPARWLATPAAERSRLAEAHRQRVAAAVSHAPAYPKWLSTYLETLP
jgi:tryptophan halogenase